MAQPEAPKPKTQPKKKLMLIRYGRMSFLGWFEHHESEIPKVNSRVVIKTRRGLELGTVVGQYSYRAGQFKYTPEQVEQYFNAPQKDFPIAEGGTFVRFATPEDIMEEKHLEASAIEEGKCCTRFIEEMNLPMKVVDSEHLFGGERIVIYFTSNGRVDFRELVRRLAREYQTRIELRQIGSRDEAKLVSDFESCGQECCCRRFLKILEPVNMRMAKLQKATLDPTKISGHCGRLKCCLRYEDDTYRDLKVRLPRKNAVVKTPHGEGRVVGVQILTQLVLVQDAKGDRAAYPLDEIESIDGRPVERAPAVDRKDEAGLEPEDDFFDGDEFGCGIDMSAPRPKTQSYGATQERAASDNEQPASVETGRQDRRPDEGSGQDRRNSNKRRRGRGRNRNRPAKNDDRGGERRADAKRDNSGGDSQTQTGKDL